MASFIVKLKGGAFMLLGHIKLLHFPAWTEYINSTDTMADNFWMYGISDIHLSYADPF